MKTLAQPFPFCESRALRSKKLHLLSSLCPDGEIGGWVDKRSIQTHSQVCPARRDNRRNHSNRAFHPRSVCRPRPSKRSAVPKRFGVPKRVYLCTKGSPP